MQHNIIESAWAFKLNVNRAVNTCYVQTQYLLSIDIGV